MAPLSPVASTVLVIWYVVGSALTTIALIALIFALYKLNASIEQVVGRLQPIIDRTDTLLVTASDRLDAISSKTELILEQGKDIAEDVHSKVDRTANAVQRTVNAPLVQSNSIMTGIQQGVSTFMRLQRGAPRSASVPQRTSVSQISVPEKASIAPPVRFQEDGASAEESPLMAIPARKER